MTSFQLYAGDKACWSCCGALLPSGENHRVVRVHTHTHTHTHTSQCQCSQMYTHISFSLACESYISFVHVACLNHCELDIIYTHDQEYIIKERSEYWTHLCSAWNMCRKSHGWNANNPVYLLSDVLYIYYLWKWLWIIGIPNMWLPFNREHWWVLYNLHYPYITKCMRLCQRLP